MLLEEFDMDEYIKMERRDSYAAVSYTHLRAHET